VTNQEAALARHGAMDPDDAPLVRGLKEAAPEAAQELCERFGPRLFAFAAAHFPGDREVAQDIMVQSLADAARSINQYDPRRSSFTAWLYGVTRGQVLDELRRRRRRKAVPAAAQAPLETIAETADASDLAEAVTGRLHARCQVARLAEALSPTELDVLVLNCLSKLSAREIARVLGRSERAVHSLLHRARMKARERLAHDE
jgi:RNA polymerase sigma-70 factor (ECF subfamily)